MYQYLWRDNDLERRKMTKNLTIRNSTVEFLIFQAQSRDDSIEVKYADETVWLSQQMIAKLFDN